MQFLIKKDKKYFQLFFSQFLVIKTLDPDWFPIRIRTDSGSGFTESVSTTLEAGIYVPHPLHCSLPPPPRSVNCRHSTPTPPRQKRRFHHRLTAKYHQQTKRNLQLFSSAGKI